jgi:hypothetical protein
LKIEQVSFIKVYDLLNYQKGIWGLQIFEKIDLENSYINID